MLGNLHLCLRVLLTTLGFGVAIVPSVSFAGPMDLGGQFSVNETGAATYTIPIQVPPGTAGIKPRLALAYSSQTGNGLLGVGWSLFGLSGVTRCPRTLAQDGVRGSVSFDTNDRYCLDGQRLIVISESDGAAGAEYRTERESYSKIVSYGTAGNGPAWFKVWTKAGQILEYGNTSDSRIEAIKAASSTATWSTGTARVWALNKVSDTLGNYFTYTYIEDQANGDYYPQRIDFTGNGNAGQAPTNSVQFVYETRPDVTPVYFSGAFARSSMRLARLTTYQSAQPAKNYRLAYGQSASTKSSILASVTECAGSDNASCLIPIALTVQVDANGSFTSQNPFTFTTDIVDWDSTNWTYGDFNGDGKTDIIQHTTTANTKRVWLSNGDGSFVPQTPFTFTSDIVGWDPTNWTYGDFNGDGKTDIIQHTTTANTKRVWLSNGDGSFAPQTPFTFTSDIVGWDPTNWTYGDFNGDGKTDIIQHTTTANTKHVWLSNGDGSFTAQTPFYFGTNIYDWSQTFWTYGDFNGDGKTDIIQHLNNDPAYTKRVWLSNGDGSFAPQTPFTFTTDIAGWDSTNWTYGDFNGDGKTDIIQHTTTANTKRVWLSNGDGSFTAQPPFYFGTDVYDWGPSFWTYGDFNGDGKIDIIQHSTTPYTKRVWFSNGDGSFTAQTPFYFGTNIYSWDPTFWTYGDFNGDGKTDIIQHLNNNPAYTKRVWFGGMPLVHADLLTTITQGNSVTLQYSPLANAIYTKDSNTTYPVRDIQGPFNVVSSAASSNVVGGTVTTNYKYGGLKAEVGTGRGLLGFRWVEAAQAETGIVTRTEYRQDWPYVGLPNLIKKTLAGSGNAGLLRQVSNIFSCLNPQLGTVCTVASGNRYFPYVSQSVEYGWDLNGVALPVVTTANQFDSYGNATQVTVSTNDSTSKTTTNTYNNDSTNWFLGRLIRSSVIAATGSDAVSTSGGGQSPPTTLDYLIIAGGGGGGGNRGGGGGAGGYVEGAMTNFFGTLAVAVGAGGSAGAGTFGLADGGNGADSSFNGVIVKGGGGGAGYSPTSAAGHSGGSAGGGGVVAGVGQTGGSATQGGSGVGHDGGAGDSDGGASYERGGGGGGATGVGLAADSSKAGNGGNGKASSITGSSITRAGGGGGGGHITAGTGGTGGGGNGSTGGTGSNATANTGSGGGGAGNGTYNGGTGGSGIVVIRYPNTLADPVATTGSPVISNTGGFKIYQWTTVGSGSITF